ncbi:MAG: maltose alpha-D-glucosyltransferase [Gammaproteobacteria bacterium]|nr:maltose alpha-D-glucosyltransferase [Rhodocyclaceae bacterium]MBU3908563.1 maltose alpha-D-glucosyltransferase [Gammaproteobacteria bacterium]MBU4004591.1 maltose alpha-D-glucosyltransferase [Gammaproteobacteria bacterium]MBU4021194.1 maltose alpha-D-glucosyltransferase [Gammaproteobacteria bacterium]MBU4096211.1 maltose alpha-D-glucosyltransferase [Gammaproteobacteria bacterium]
MHIQTDTALGTATAIAADLEGDTLWYKDAVIYELHIKAYADGNGDGIGDFRGLTERLDHVQSLGVNTIWLLPFYPSPQRDDGYDVADYENVHPSYGTLDDFRAFVNEAHRRKLRVITELVVNHTSDQHPWFQAARSAPKDSPERNFYVWSDDPKKYSGTRIIFTDTEKSNWTWDEVAQQYFWHRFFSHQPDLNFDNPAVLQAVLNTMEFWLEMGVDGFRLDAIPYLIERDGTSNENLRETHDVIKEIRRRLEAKYPGRLLLAEANMWPEDVHEYFGDGDECQMAYHFPLMPRLYMAIAQEDRHPVVEILAQTPDIPANCQWAVFLRNHDELTLEMVTSKERDYMYNMYAAESRARINIGIRRRLAPLLENNPDRIKLMNSMLLSMLGTPVLYYGDEIGMGDNIFLGDRDGVRTPMQWSTDRNGGFSRADPQRLYLPPIQDPIYGFEAVNVEAQAREPSSLLSWTRHLLAIRATTQAFGRGSVTMMHPGNRKILAYLREYQGEVILCVANVSRVAQSVELDLGAYKGRVPVEMTGRSAFPPIGKEPYFLTLMAYGFFWFRLSLDTEPPEWHTDRTPVEDLAVVVLFDEWNSFFRNRVVPWRIAMAEKTRAQLESQILPRFLLRQRWYAAKTEPLQHAAIAEYAMLQAGETQWLMALVDIHGAAKPARYFVPLALSLEESESERTHALSAVAIAKVRQQANTGVLADAMADEDFCRAMVNAIGAKRELKAEGGTLRFSPSDSFVKIVGDTLKNATPLTRLTASSNSVSLLGDRLFLKAYRHLHDGISPELEMGRFLTDAVGFKHCVPVAGSVDFHAANGAIYTLALLQEQVTNQGDAWSHTVGQFARLLDSSGAIGDETHDDAGPLVERMQVLARRIAQLHIALARPTGDPAFDPEPIQPLDLTSWVAAVEDECRGTLETMTQRAAAWEKPLAELGARIVEALPALVTAINRAAHSPPPGVKTRLHGDLHLGQVLICHDDFLLIDFEGEPKRTLAERRAKHSALRDVAGMLRSFDYARHAALHQSAATGADFERLAISARQWERSMREGFLQTYGQVAVDGGLYADAAEFAAAKSLIDLFELEKAFYELRYEMDNRPDWIGVPLVGIAALAGVSSQAKGDLP